MNNDEKKLVKIGNYVLTGKMLGKGHFATVVEAVHTILNIKVAIKIINLKEITDEYVKNNFRREGLIMSHLCHPNIIHLFEILETARNYYLVTEIGVGGDLCAFIRTQVFGKLDEKQAKHFGRQLVSAVEHLHERGIIHRDLKMENILLDRNREKLKIIDFGLTNICKSNELLKTHCGSPEYAAPELYISGRKYGPEVDIWSLGVIFYGMVMGKLPFQASQKVQISQEERRKYLMTETQKGLDIKHQKALFGQSYHFRNLMLKMLNPNSQKRISVTQLQMHPWIISNAVKGYPTLDANFQKSAVTKIGKALNIPFSEIISEIKKKPFGSIGGLYNIKKCGYLNYKLKNEELNGAKSSLRIRPRSATNTEIFSPYDVLPVDKQRPRTTNGQKINLFRTSPEKMEVPTSSRNTTSMVEPKLASRKMLQFFNEKFSQVLNIYSKNPRKKNIAEDVAKMEILPANSRLKSAPRAKPTNSESDKAPNQICGAEVELPGILCNINPEYSTMPQPNSVRFIPCFHTASQKNNDREWIPRHPQAIVQSGEPPNILGKLHSNYTRISSPHLSRKSFCNQTKQNFKTLSKESYSKLFQPPNNTVSLDIKNQSIRSVNCNKRVTI